MDLKRNKTAKRFQQAGCMMNSTEEARRYGHVTVSLLNYIMIIGGSWLDSQSVIWTYDLYSEKWKKYETPEENIPPKSYWSCAAAIGQCHDVFMFGGLVLGENSVTNELWKLSTQGECFHWSNISMEDKSKTPSPRSYHTGWGYQNNFWTFGGNGISPDDYLCDNGSFENDCNNQLLCFDPFSTEWSDLKCTGSVPSPRARHATTMFKHKVWLFGGRIFTDEPLNDLYELDMTSLTWTKLPTKMSGRYLSTLTAVSDSQLVLHGGIKGEYTTLNDTWILDLPSLTWKQYTAKTDHSRAAHTASLGFENSVIIIGGLKQQGSTYETYTTTFCMRLQPRRLEQLAMEAVYVHKDVLPWKYMLPQKLIVKHGISESEEKGAYDGDNGSGPEDMETETTCG